MGFIDKMEEVARIQREIESLNDKKDKYALMNTKINYLVEELKTAQNHIKKASEELGRSYNSKEVSKRVTGIENIHSEVGKIMNDLNGEILEAVSKKMDIISEKITSKKQQIKKILF